MNLSSARRSLSAIPLGGGKEVLCKNGLSFSQCLSRSPRCARHRAPVDKSPFPLLSLTFLPSKTPLSRCPYVTLVRFLLTCSGFSTTPPYLPPPIEPLKGPPHCQLSSGTWTLSRPLWRRDFSKPTHIYAPSFSNWSAYSDGWMR